MGFSKLKFLGGTAIRFPFLDIVKGGKTVKPQEVFTVSEREKKALMKMNRGVGYPLFEIQEETK